MEDMVVPRPGFKQTEEAKLKMSKAHKGLIPWNKGKHPEYMQGKNHHNWKGGPPKCMDCGKKIRIRFTRCRRCSKLGSKHYNWKGGITSLRESIRGLSDHRKWSLAVLVRDNFTCQKCFKRGGSYLHAHHLKSFSDIFKEFLQEYNQFSPIEDKETLARLAINYKPFWDVNNGQTLCKDCHKQTDNYSYKGVKYATQRN